MVFRIPCFSVQLGRQKGGTVHIVINRFLFLDIPTHCRTVNTICICLFARGQHMLYFPEPMNIAFPYPVRLTFFLFCVPCVVPIDCQFRYCDFSLVHAVSHFEN